ncbi:hypothetical protein F0562_004129 [Nyssa sinensis]|uniref:Uncharacterized protein n=1 Tax=Nyssa sinensis TaxID=561372 RepID=A0A5J5C0K7_9ASTE|nr:hypothetical protein F0562_004129 [Nyssa sinensis]
MLIAGNGCADTKNLSKPVSEDIHSNQLLQAPDHTLHSRQNADETFIEGSTTVPQARKATLARFLEKRKDRLINVGHTRNQWTALLLTKSDK